jgi:hypothetical protein
MRRVLALLLALLSAALAFKDAEMKKCSDLYFCRTCVRRFARRSARELSQPARALRRNRARKPGAELYQIKARGHANAPCTRGACAAPRRRGSARRAADAP